MIRMEKKFEEVLKDSETYAKKNGFKLNPNKKAVETIINGLIKREKEFGERYCPCRRVDGNPEADKNIICPCIYHKTEIKESGHCHCFLFVSGDK